MLSVARNYWRPDKDFDFRPENSPESERFLDLWEQEFKKMDQWRAFLRELGGALPDFNIGNATSTCDACFRCSVYPRAENKQQPRRWVVVGCVSILAPVYTLYGVQYSYRGRERITERIFFDSFPPEMQAPAETVARRIEATFGVTALPRELAETPIPLIVEPQEPPHTTLFHALFISRPERVP
ncbi:hypothetical protein [Vitiosangium sp. GDMCC 1.1324]|uniref:hypothetical protein n=1 Tax=Vitiosangium sp. (strain GDMCC 1.1324) TaxID=2138576 RepID=UPI00130D7954|nr:hypothetical protein [Vitiosangium sp. GDMCC 1.1324]